MSEKSLRREMVQMTLIVLILNSRAKIQKYSIETSNVELSTSATFYNFKPL